MIEITAICDGGAVRFQLPIPGRGKADNLVARSVDGEGNVAVLLGRLYYRSELKVRLAGEPVEAASDDAALALAAYRHFGSECFAELEGDFTLFVWDAREQKLFAGRTPLGAFPLFWVRQQDTVVVSTSIRPLVPWLRHRRWSEAFLAEYLVLPACGMNEVPRSCTIYREIQRVRPGERLEVDPASGRVETGVYWNWLDRIEVPATQDEDGLAHRFHDLLSRAVRERLHGRVAAHLSGGIDSTAVTLLAQQQLTASGRREGVHALSLVYERLSLLRCETAYLDHAIAQHPELELHRLSADDALDFDDFDGNLLLEEPCAPMFRTPMNRVLVEAAARVGADTILTGYGGDEFAGVPPFHLAELVRRGRLVQAWREAARWAAVTGVSRWGCLQGYALPGLLPTWLRGGLRLALQGGYADWRRQRVWTLPPWIRPEVAREHHLWQRALSHQERMYRSCRPTALSVALAAVQANAGDAVRWYFSAPRGILQTHPFLDRRLICFGLGMQAHVIPEPGPAKRFLSCALKDTLPARIRERRGKGHFNEVFFLGLARNLPTLERLVQDAPLDALGWFERGRLLDCLRQAALGIGCDAQGVDRLNLTLSLLYWFGQEKAFLAQPPTPTQEIVAGQPRGVVPSRGAYDVRFHPVPAQ